MTHRLGLSLHFPEEILAAASDPKTELRWPFRRVLGLVAMSACWIVQLRMGVAAVAPKVVKVRDQCLVRSQELGRLHDWQAAPQTAESRHALVHDRTCNATAFDVAPNGHGPHV